MPALESSGEIRQLEAVRYLPRGSTIRVDQVAQKWTVNWYRVTVESSGLSGWINSIALIGQDIELSELPAPPPATLAKFNLIENGMTLQQIEHIVGAPGKLVSSTTLWGVPGAFEDSKSEGYLWEGVVGNMIVVLESGTVVMKMQFSLE